MPNGMVEILWKPGQADMDTVSTRGPTTSVQPDFDDKSGITLSVTGIPANTGVRVRFVAVYEWFPDTASSGLVTTVGTPPPTYNTLTDIMRKLDSTGRWFLKTTWDNREYIGEFAAAMTAMTMI
jgi:hypothetical protein